MKSPLPKDGFGQVIERLDRVSRAMNPVLLFVAVSLVVLNLACVVNLIDWRDPSQHPPSATAGDAAAPTSQASNAPTALPKVAPPTSAPGARSLSH